MKPDLTDEQGHAAIVVATNGHAHSMNYILTTSGDGLMVENEAGGAAWRPFTALPSGVDIAEVAFWNPWTICTNAGVWYFRAAVLDAWEANATGSETRPETVPARDPKVQITIV
jgi:hypothetical protein